MRFNHDGEFLAIGTEDTTLLVLRTETGDQALALQLREKLEYLCWHPSKDILAYAGDKASSDSNSKRDGVLKWIEITDRSSR